MYSFVNISKMFDRECWLYCNSQEIGCEDRL